MDFSDHPKGANKKSTLDHGKDVNMIKRTVCKYEQYVINEKCLFNRSYR